MEAIPLNQVLSALFVSTIGLTCLYTFISTMVFYWSLSGIKQSKVRNFIFLLFITVFIGFLYAGWNFVNLVGLIATSEFNRNVLNNIFITNILALVIYMSFSARHLGQSKVSKKGRLSQLMSTAAQKGSRIKF